MEITHNTDCNQQYNDDNDKLARRTELTNSDKQIEQKMVEKLLRYSQVYDKETVEYLEEEFTRLEDNCYLDHAGATLYSKTQMKNVFDDLDSTVYGNPHSLGIASKQTLDAIDQIRFRILDHFHTNVDEYSLIFTSSATDSLKIVSNCFKFSNNNNKISVGNFVYLQDNHTSVLGMREVVSKKGVRIYSLSNEEAFKVFKNSDNKNNNDKIEEESTELLNQNFNDNSNSLFVYPAQCNFSGLKYPLPWINKLKINRNLDYLTNENKSTWFTLLDAASFVPTNDLNLNLYRPDFVCLSFYKMFGYPTGLGALLVKKSAEHTLEKIYYGGGTVQISLSSDLFHSKKTVLHERFEDGTLPFLSIISLRHGFDTFSKISIQKISQHVFSLAKYFHDYLLILHHSNGKPLANLYNDTSYENCNSQGGLVSFNLLRSNGENIGFIEFLNVANLNKIHVRTGCFCNPGACQRHLNISNDKLKDNFTAGHVCGDDRDLMDGKPTGGIRVSFGYMSKISDVKFLINVIKNSFLSKPEVIKIPDWWKGFKDQLETKYDDDDYGSRIFDEQKDDDRDVKIVEEENLENVQTGEIKLIEFDDRVGNKNSFKLKKLFIYPVKSCANFEINDSWIIGDKGLAYDREWMITTASGVCLTQKQEIKLCLIKPTVNRGENLLELNYPGMPAVKIPLKMSPFEIKSGILCRSKICGHKVEGIDCGSDVSEWLSLCLGRPGLRLVKQNEKKKTSIGEKRPEISFSSQAQYLLINESSIKWLSEKIPENSGCDRNTILDRFRGNVIVEGSEPFEEMKWSSLKIGKTKFKVDGQCTRCQMICIDQTTGKKTVEPLRTLAEEFQGKMRFGIYLSRESNGENSFIKIGDEVIYE